MKLVMFLERTVVIGMEIVACLMTGGEEKHRGMYEGWVEDLLFCQPILRVRNRFPSDCQKDSFMQHAPPGGRWCGYPLLESSQAS